MAPDQGSRGDKVAATARRSSLRRAIKESLRDRNAVPSATTPPSTLSRTLSSSSSIAKKSASAAPSSLASAPRTRSLSTAATANSSPSSTKTSPSTTPSRRSRRQLALKQSRRQLGNKLGSAHPSYSSQGAQEDKVDTNGILTSRKGWHRIREILAEARNQDGHLIYFVDWEGSDPRTGVSWPGSWVNANNVSATAVREWKDKQNQERDAEALN
ncbi:hypothetical protein GGS26DRAFT_499682 [Hypomontagnella submonticulosa]|nr:hypothetical protein GGS26DRAFT_499682 [Hypomontagnella submonticulosa]